MSEFTWSNLSRFQTRFKEVTVKQSENVGSEGGIR